MNAHTYNAPTISAGTIARTACLLLALTNQVLSAGQLKVHGSQTRSMCSSWQAIR